MERVLDLEEIDTDFYRAPAVNLWKPLGARGVFGGQVLGQALAACSKTVGKEFSPNSLHAYFLLAGNVDQNIIYRVDRHRDGRSYATRSVVAYQKGRAIFNSVTSFAKLEHSELEHQKPMPSAPPPEQLPDERQSLQNLLHNPKVPKHYHERILNRINQPFPIDLRPCEAVDYLNPLETHPPYQLVWLRCATPLGDEMNTHRCVAAYASDHYLLTTALLPFGYPTRKPTWTVSLDHSMWFHAPFRADEWMLYELESPRASGGRGLSFGRLFTKDGVLAVSVAQEGVIRVRDKQPPKITQTTTSKL